MQVIVGVMAELFVLIPSLLFLQAFRFVQASSWRYARIVLYLIAAALMLTSIFFIVARGLEFGEAKSRQWLISILTGFISSIVLTQPLKVRSFTSSSSLIAPNDPCRSSVCPSLSLVSAAT